MASEVASLGLLRACVVGVSRHICYLSTHTLSSAAHERLRSSDYRFVSATGFQAAPDWLQLCRTVPSVRAETENQGKFLFWPSRNRKRASTDRWKYDRSLWIRSGTFPRSLRPKLAPVCASNRPIPVRLLLPRWRKQTLAPHFLTLPQIQISIRWKRSIFIPFLFILIRHRGFHANAALVSCRSHMVSSLS